MAKDSQAYPPGPKGRGILGLLPELRRDQFGTLVRSLQTYGDIVHATVLGRHVYLINNPDYTRRLLVEKADHVHKSALLRQGAGDYIGLGLLLSEDDLHKRQRKLIQPTFNHARISGYGDIMVNYADQTVARWRNGQQMDIAEEMFMLTLAIVNKTLFGADLPKETDQINHAIGAAMEDVVRSNMGMRLPKWLPTARNRQRREIGVLFKTVIDKTIEDRRRSGEQREDLLSTLLAATDDEGAKMSQEQLRHEMLTLFIAGHETTANALAWTFYLLAKNPAVMDKLAAEIDRVLGGRLPTVADLSHMPYLEMVLKESMRLYPPAWIIGRRVLKAFEIGGYTLPVGSAVIAMPYVAHHDPRYFPDPERFDPERFTPEREAALPRYAYIPFGAGPRVCIGNGFAMMEAQLILATVLGRYAFELLDSAPPALEPLVTLRPKGGIRVRAVAREGIRV